MRDKAQDNEKAAAYLRDNQQLRTAVGAREGDDLQPRALGLGEHNLNFRFTVPATGKEHVLRVNVATQPFHDDQVGYEFAALQALAPSGCTPKPFYLDNTPTAPGKGALVIGFCEGDELDFDHLRAGDLACAAQLMADVHAAPVPDDCPLHCPSDPLQELFEECLQRFQMYRASTCEDPRITTWTESFIDVARRTLEQQAAAKRGTKPAHDCRCIVNTEPLPSHFLIPARSADKAARTARILSTGRFCAHPGAFVDWERPIVGEAAQDVAYFTSPTTTFWDSDFLFPASQVDDFVEDYWRAVDGRFERETFDERFRAWRMMTALRSVTWCCRALVNCRKPGAHTTEKALRKLPIYLTDEFMEMLATDCFGL